MLKLVLHPASIWSCGQALRHLGVTLLVASINLRTTAASLVTLVLWAHVQGVMVAS